MYQQVQDTLKIQNATPSILYVPESTDTAVHDLDTNISVHTAKTINDVKRVFKIRWQGYKKYFSRKDQNVDKFDFSPNVTFFLAEDQYHRAVGTLRILDRRYGAIELDEFIDVDSFLSEPERSCIEATRFSIPKHPDAKLIKYLLWKALFLHCQKNNVHTILYSGRPSAVRSYRCLSFENVGPAGTYNHALLGGLEHHTYKCNIAKGKDALKINYPQLYAFLFTEEHSNPDTGYYSPHGMIKKELYQ